MAMPGVQATTEGTRLLSALMERLAGRLERPQAMWPLIGDVVAETLQEQFDTEGSRFLGRQWAPLSPKYLAWKIKKGLDPRRLRATGAMADSLTSRPMAVETYGEDSARFWTDDPKVEFHQFGTRFMPARKSTRFMPARKSTRFMPARKILVMNDEDFQDDIEQVVARYMFEELMNR